MINVTESDIVSVANIDDLFPHGTPRPYYVAAVLKDEYDPTKPFVLGDGKNTTFEGISYINVPISLGTYRYFVRAYTIGPVSLMLYGKK